MLTESVPLQLPDGIEAFVTYKEGEGPKRDRKGRLRVRRAILVSADRGQGFVPPSDLSKSDLLWVLQTGDGRRRWKGIQSRWGERPQPKLYALVRCGAIALDTTVDDKRWPETPVAFSLSDTWAARAPDKIKELTGREAPAVVRGALLDLLRGIEQFKDEYALLAAQDLDAPLSAPKGSRTGTTWWSPYEFALRLAHWWWTKHDHSRIPVPAEALAHSHAHTKGTKETWKSTPRIDAFENFMGKSKSFSDYFDEVDYDIRVRGPLSWIYGTKLADARTARPWVGLPSNGARRMGALETDGAVGILVLENQQTFHVVAKEEAVTREWICVWGKGKAAHGVIEFLRMLAPLPIAVWGDLDAAGVGIVVDLERRVGRSVHPVGMDVEHWLTGPHLRTEEKTRQDNIKQARSLLDRGVPPALKPLTEQIVEHPEHAGKVLEQEGQHPKVLPLLPGLLDRVLETHRART